MAASDFQLQDGLPWSIPLLMMSDSRNVFRSFQQLLLVDGLVTLAFLEEYTKTVQRGTRVIHSLGQLFSVDFRRSHLDYYVLTGTEFQPTAFQQDIFTQHQTLMASTHHAPVNLNSADPVANGWGVPVPLFAAFNDLHYHNTEVFVWSLRIIKITSSIINMYPNYNSYIVRPKEADLFRRRPRGIDPGNSVPMIPNTQPLKELIRE